MTDYYYLESPSLSPTDSPPSRIPRSKAFKDLSGDLTENFNQKTPEQLLLSFARKGKLRGIQELFEHLSSRNAAINVNYVDEEGNSAVMLAAENGHTDVILYLLSFYGYRQVSLNEINNQGKTAIELARQYKHATVGVLLADRGAHIRSSEIAQWVNLCRSMVTVLENLAPVDMHMPSVSLPPAAVTDLTCPTMVFSPTNSWSQLPPVQLDRRCSDGMSVLDALSPRGRDKVCLIKAR